MEKIWLIRTSTAQRRRLPKKRVISIANRLVKEKNLLINSQKKCTCRYHSNPFPTLKDFNDYPLNNVLVLKVEIEILQHDNAHLQEISKRMHKQLDTLAEICEIETMPLEGIEKCITSLKEDFKEVIEEEDTQLNSV